MKKIYRLIVLAIVVLIPTNVFAWYDQNTCQNVANAYSGNGNNSISARGNIKQCVRNACVATNASSNSQYNYTVNDVTVWAPACTNGNTNPYLESVNYEDNLATGDCSSNKDYRKYTIALKTYDCTRTSSGSNYSGSNIGTTKATTTVKNNTTKKTTKKTYYTTRSHTTTTKAATTVAETTTVETTTTTTSVAVSSDASIKKITLNETDLKYKAGTNEYNVKVPYSTESFNVEVTTKDKNANVAITGDKNITSDGGIITIVVTSEDGTNSNTVTLNITRYTKEQGDCSLANIYIKNYEDFTFSSTKEEYTLDLQNDEKSLDIEVTTNQEDANYKIDGNEKLKNGSVITVTVDAADGTTCNYNITVKKKNTLWIYIVVFIGLAVVIFFVGKKLRDYLIMGHGKYKYE